MSETNSDDCYLCGGSGEVEITPFGLPDDQCDSFGCPACIAAERDKEIAELRQQRDKLLAALEKCRDMVGHPDNVDFINAAIAEVKGQS